MEYTRQHRVDNIEAEDVGLPLDQYGRPSIPIIYIPNPFYQMTVQASMCPSNPNRHHRQEGIQEGKNQETKAR